MPPLYVTCFAACYGIALALEALGLFWRAPARRLCMVTIAAAGVLAHTWYLGQRASARSISPLASAADWCLLAAWLLAVIYVAQALYYQRAAIGLFLLPLVLGLIGASRFASNQPFAPERASRFWGNVHGSFLLLGTVAVSVGFLSGVMYLVQSYRLKRKLPPIRGFNLPSLEWLEAVNSRSLGISALFMGVGFVSGVILNTHLHRGDATYVPWTDPVVISLALMMLWLVIAELFRMSYPAARQGRKVAYLTVAAFVFLCITLASLLLLETDHGKTRENVRRTLSTNTKYIVSRDAVAERCFLRHSVSHTGKQRSVRHGGLATLASRLTGISSCGLAGGRRA